jgi:hypothetical protein
MKNFAASGWVSSFEKKSLSDFSHVALGVRYPDIIGEGIEPPHRAGVVSRLLRI